MRIRARRRNIALIACALLVFPAGIATSLLVLPDGQIARAASTGAQNLADLINGRSPGERAQGLLTKTKHARALAKQFARPEPLENVPIKPYVPTLAEVVTAPPLVPPPELQAIFPTIEAAPTPPGLIGVPTGPGGFTPPGGTPETPVVPPDTPTPPPAVPEPGTWALMLLGFGLIGWRVRKGEAQARVRRA